MPNVDAQRSVVRSIAWLDRIASQLNAFGDIDELEALNENHVYLGSVPWPNVSRRDHHRDSVETTSFRETVADLSK